MTPQQIDNLQALYDAKTIGSVEEEAELYAAVSEALPELLAMARENKQLRKELKLQEHKTITCGVAASHPDAGLASRDAYADKWDSPQAQAVRELRADRDRYLAALKAEAIGKTFNTKGFSGEPFSITREIGGITFRVSRKPDGELCAEEVQ